MRSYPKESKKEKGQRYNTYLQCWNDLENQIKVNYPKSLKSPIHFEYDQRGLSPFISLRTSFLYLKGRESL